MQPVIIDKNGDPRFQENKLVSWMLGQLEKKGVSLNDFPVFDDIPQGDWEQFYQMIGYSVGGYCELKRVGRRSANAAVREAKKLGFPWQQGHEAVAEFKRQRGIVEENKEQG